MFDKVEYMRAWYLRNKKYQQKYMKLWRKKHPKYSRLKGKEHRNKNEYSGLRIIALNRDNWSCEVCGITNEAHLEKYGREITVHHKDGRGRHSKIKNNTLNNLITLCLSCHGKIHRGGKSK